MNTSGKKVWSKTKSSPARTLTRPVTGRKRCGEDHSIVQAAAKLPVVTWEAVPTCCSRGAAAAGEDCLKMNSVPMKTTELQMLWKLVKDGEKRPLPAAEFALLLRIRFALQEYEAKATPDRTRGDV
jgi:hypothetical protein